jgi:hypothetical protein
MVLSRAELGKMLDVAKEKEASPPEPPPSLVAPQPQAVPAAPAPMAGLIVAFLMGAALGAAAMYLISHR